LTQQNLTHPRKFFNRTATHIYVNPFRSNTYDATFVYLIRQQGELTIHTDHHVLGLFSQAIWEKLFNDSELSMQKTSLNGIYGQYILGGGECPLTIFAG